MNSFPEASALAHLFGDLIVKRLVKNIIKRILPASLVVHWQRRWAAFHEVRSWEKSGRPHPPPHLVKQRVVKQYARKFSLTTLVETGTFYGAMVEASKTTFDRIFSVELDETLFQGAREKFHRLPYVTIVQGDSGKVLPTILAQIEKPCLFWLDGHYSAGVTALGDKVTPILAELEHIFSHPVSDHVILIDDARLFNGQDGYPLLDEVRKFIMTKRPHWAWSVRDDIIRAHPRL